MLARLACSGTSAVPHLPLPTFPARLFPGLPDGVSSESVLVLRNTNSYGRELLTTSSAQGGATSERHALTSTACRVVKMGRADPMLGSLALGLPLVGPARDGLLDGWRVKLWSRLIDPSRLSAPLSKVIEWEHFDASRASRAVKPYVTFGLQ